MRNLFTNLFEVKPTDNFGTAVVKKLGNGYVQGVLAAGAGLGMLALMVSTINKKIESDKEDAIEVVPEEVTETTDESNKVVGPEDYVVEDVK